MSLARTLALVSGLSASLLAAPAFAGDVAGTVSQSSTPAVSRAIEIAIAGGYSQGTGDIGDGMSSVDDLSQSGGGGELRIGYRLIPNLTLGVYGTASGYARGDDVADDTHVLGASAGVFSDWHFLPAESVDPWLSLSSGWRGMWLTRDDDVDTSLQGLEVARLQAGVDYRVLPSVAIAPVVGASASVFLTQKGPGMDDYQDIEDPELNVFFFGGLQGRFDLQ